MKTIKKVEIKPVYVEFIPDELEEKTFYISEEYGTIMHNCLCGCGAKTVTPIDAVINGVDHGWKLIKEKDDKISMTPSIANYQMPCKSHYILTKNVANFV